MPGGVFASWAGLYLERHTLSFAWGGMEAAQPARDLCIESPSALACLISPVDASQHRTHTGIVATTNKMACFYAAGFCREHPAVRWGELHS